MTRLISSGVGTRDRERRPIGIAVGERDQLLIIGLGGADSLLASLQHQPRPNPTPVEEIFYVLSEPTLLLALVRVESACSGLLPINFAGVRLAIIVEPRLPACV